MLEHSIIICDRQVVKARPDLFEKKDGWIYEAMPRLDEGEDVEVADEEGEEERGLSHLVKQCLGKPLDTHQRVSNWEIRPLRQQQIDYAGKKQGGNRLSRQNLMLLADGITAIIFSTALSAYVLLEVYEMLKAKMRTRGGLRNLEPVGGHRVDVEQTMQATAASGESGRETGYRWRW